MTTLTHQDRIQNAIETISMSESKYQAGLAKLVLSAQITDHGDHTPSYAVYAAAYNNWESNETASNEMKALSGPEVKFKPVYYNIAFYSFVQSIMNRVCWDLRRGAEVRLNQDENERIKLNTGLDFADIAAEELDEDYSSLSAIKESADDVYQELQSLSSYLAQKFGIDSAPLKMFSQSKKLPNGTYVVETSADDWDTAKARMDSIAQRLKEEANSRLVAPTRPSADGTLPWHTGNTIILASDTSRVSNSKPIAESTNTLTDSPLPNSMVSPF